MSGRHPSGSGQALTADAAPEAEDDSRRASVEDTLEDDSGHLIIPSSGSPIDDEVVQALRRADQR